MTSTINHLITTPEGKTLEFKRDLSSPKPLIQEFAGRVHVTIPISEPQPPAPAQSRKSDTTRQVTKQVKGAGVTQQVVRLLKN